MQGVSTTRTATGTVQGLAAGVTTLSGQVLNENAQPVELFFQDLPEEEQEGCEMAPVVADELAHPAEIRLFGPETIVLDADGIADPIEESV